MSLQSVRDQLLTTLAASTTFAATYGRMPADAPARMPALILRYIDSTVEQPTFASAGQSQHCRFFHNFEAIVLIGSAGQTGQTDKIDNDAMTFINAITGQINYYSVKAGYWTEAIVESVEIQGLQWPDVTVYGIVTRIRVTEDT